VCAQADIKYGVGVSIWNSDAVYDLPEVADLVSRARGGAIDSTAELRHQIAASLDTDLSARDRLNLMMAQVTVSQGSTSGVTLLQLVSDVRDFVSVDRQDITESHRFDAISMVAAISAIVGDTRMCFDLCTELATHLSNEEAVQLSEPALVNYAVTLMRLGAYEIAASYLVEPLTAALEGGQPEKIMVPALNLLVAVSRSQIVSDSLAGHAPGLTTKQHEQLDLADRGLAFVVENASTEQSRNVARASRAYAAICCGHLDRAVDIWGDLDALKAHPAENFTSFLTIVEAYLAIHQDRYERALTVLDQCLIEYDTYDSLPLREIEGLRLRSQVHERLGNLEHALADTKAAVLVAMSEQSELPSLLMDELARRGAVEQSREELLERTTELAEQSLIDELTGLGNRRALDLYIGQLRDGEPVDVAMLVLDIDEFKRINDTFGHHVGDQAIKAAAALLVASCRRTDRLVRYGGEEFVVLPASASLTHGVALAERIRSAFVDHDWSTAGVTGSITCSVGVAGGSSTDVHRIFQVADKRMYAAKRAGRDRVVSAQDHLDV